MKPFASSLAMTLACCVTQAPVAHAEGDGDLSAIREEMKALREGYDAQRKAYEARMKALEERLEKAEARAAAAEAGAAQARSAAAPAEKAADNAAMPAPAATATDKQTVPNAFNPAISLILNGAYSNLSQDPNAYKVTGFLSNQDAIAAGKLPLRRGFGLGESEMFLTSNIDHLFAGGLNLALEPDNTVSIEEAFVQTTALGHGLTVKGGRFFSALGYQNSVHAHAWDFVDPSLVQNTFFGPNYGDDGLQVNWVAPVEAVLFEVGAEIGRGKDAPANDRGKNGIASSVYYAHLGGDAGTGGSYRVGVSTLRTSTGPGGSSVADLDERTGVVNRFTGDIAVDGLDFVYKWAPNGDYYYTNLKLAAEWFRMRRDGTLFYDVTGIDRGAGFSSAQSGWYVQGTWQFHPYWRVGARYDQLDPGSMSAGVNAQSGIVATTYAPRKYSAMVDWNPSEFSRIRLQYSRDGSREGLTDNQWFLQYNYSLGTHGAHKF